MIKFSLKDISNRYFLSAVLMYFILVISVIAFSRAPTLGPLKLVPDLFLYSLISLLLNLVIYGENGLRRRAAWTLVAVTFLSVAFAYIFLTSWVIFGSLVLPAQKYLGLSFFYPHCGHGCEFNIQDVPSVRFADGFVRLIPFFLIFSFAYAFFAQVFRGKKKEIGWREFGTIFGLLIVGLLIAAPAIFLRYINVVMWIIPQSVLLVPAIWYTAKLVDLSTFKLAATRTTFIYMPAIVLISYIIIIFWIRLLFTRESYLFSTMTYDQGNSTIVWYLTHILQKMGFHFWPLP